MKPSEKFSVVPEAVRNKFREMRRGEEAPMKGNGAPTGGPSMSDREVLKRMIEDEKMDMKEDAMEGEGMAKGGMVRRKYAKGGMVQVRGYGKARSKPCKIC
jgi:hypothetical protein